MNEEGFQVVSCSDNGIGMDESIITDFLTKAGRSYYRSPEFSQQRIGFLEKGVDFDPCAQFGIGFMSCFMFGDQIKIKTRRDFGPEGGYGDPLEVEINGLGGILVIRSGHIDQPIGTIVEITGPQKPVYIDKWTDEVCLCGVVYGYALATEFPIEVSTEIENIKENLYIPTDVAIRKTLVEEKSIIKSKVIEYNLKSIDERLRGLIRIGLLLDNEGLPTIENDEAKYTVKHNSENQTINFETASGVDQKEQYREKDSTSLDGILVCGTPGRSDERLLLLGENSNALHLGDPFLVDIRGSIKPRITPSRNPVSNSFESDRSWARIQSMLKKAHSNAWSWVLESLGNGLTDFEFWRLSFVHNVPVYLMDIEALWKYIKVPIVDIENKGYLWLQLSELKSIELIPLEKKYSLNCVFYVPGKGNISLLDDLSQWFRGLFGDFVSSIEKLVLRFAQIDIIDDSVAFNLCQYGNIGSEEHELRFQEYPGSLLPLLQYVGHASEFVSVRCPLCSVNSQHPLIQFVHQFFGINQKGMTNIQDYCYSMMGILVFDKSLCSMKVSDNSWDWLHRKVGILYKNINWECQDDMLKPPYKIWSKESGAIEVDEEQILAWAELPQVPDSTLE